MVPNILAELIRMFVLSVAVAAMSATIALGAIFDRPRAWIMRRSSFWGSLVSCPYCASHWIAFGAVLVFRPLPLKSGIWIGLDLLASAFAVIGLSAMLLAIIKPVVRGSHTESDDMPGTVHNRPREKGHPVDHYSQ